MHTVYTGTKTSSAQLSRLFKSSAAPIFLVPMATKVFVFGQRGISLNKGQLSIMLLVSEIYCHESQSLLSRISMPRAITTSLSHKGGDQAWVMAQSTSSNDCSALACICLMVWSLIGWGTKICGIMLDFKIFAWYFACFINPLLTTAQEGIPAASNHRASCMMQVVQEPQSARDSTQASHSLKMRCLKAIGHCLENVGFW